MTEKIEIQMVSDTLTSKAGNDYFTIEDDQQKRYVCFNPKLKEYCQVGGEIDADLTQSKKPDGNPTIDMIYIDGKPVIEKPKQVGRSFGKSKEEQKSIERQVAVKLACEISSDNEPLEAILRKAEQIYKWISVT